MSEEIDDLNATAMELICADWGNSIEFNRNQHQAMLLLRSALERDGSNVRTLTNLGCALCNAGRYPQAIEYLKKAAELQSGDGNTYFNLAVSMMNVDAERSSAKAYFERAKQLAADGRTVKAHLDFLAC